MSFQYYPNRTLSFPEKLKQFHFGFLLFVCLTMAFGLGILYSAADGSFNPWASKQFIRFILGLGVFFVISFTPIQFWLRAAYPLYAIGLILLMAVEIKGQIGMGAQRWIDLGFIQFQPSEFMKIIMVLTLARYFHYLPADMMKKNSSLIIPALLVFFPAALVMLQPDLGTAGMILMSAAAMLFLAGVQAWKFILVIILGLLAIPIGWEFLHEYQQKRVLTFLDPSQDPLGAGYHIIQSKIALGSGGIIGKGFLQGTQSHLNFLPEKQTDFIFTIVAEEFGFIGGVFLLILYGLILFNALIMSLKVQNQFGRLVIMGINVTFFLYIFINMAMVMGLIPVVGVPLPFMSYGGTAMLTLLFGFGILMSAYIHRGVTLKNV